MSLPYAGATACAGLGLFFVGMRTITSHLRELAGGRLRALLARTLQRASIAPIAGFFAGALTQSTSAVTFIATGLIAARATTLATALVMLAWANVGTSILVLIAAIDVHALVLYLFALCGIAYFSGLEQTERYRHTVVALLGLGLLLFGLSTLKGAVVSLNTEPWAREFVEFAGSGTAIAFLVGFVVAVAVSSSSIVVVLALPLIQEGVLSLDASAFLVFGACVGSGGAVILLSSGLDGASRQLALAQGLLRALAVLLLLPLYFVEHYSGLPLLLVPVRMLASAAVLQMGLLFLIAQVATVVVVMVLGRVLVRFVSWISPLDATTALDRPHYLFDEAVKDAATALKLAQLEHAAVIGVLPDFLDELRPIEERSASSPSLNARQAASSVLVIEIQQFLTATLHSNPEMGAEEIYDLRRRLIALGELQGAIYQFARELLAVPQEERPAFCIALIEGLHAVLGVAVETTLDQAADAFVTLEILTAERGGLMDSVRAELLGGATSISGREALLSATLLFERIMWMLRLGNWRISAPL